MVVRAIIVLFLIAAGWSGAVQAQEVGSSASTTHAVGVADQPGGDAGPGEVGVFAPCKVCGFCVNNCHSVGFGNCTPSSGHSHCVFCQSGEEENNHCDNPTATWEGECEEVHDECVDSELPELLLAIRDQPELVRAAVRERRNLIVNRERSALQVKCGEAIVLHVSVPSEVLTAALDERAQLTK